MTINLNTLIGNSQTVGKDQNKDVLGKMISLLKSSKPIRKKDKTLNTSCKYIYIHIYMYEIKK